MTQVAARRRRAWADLVPATLATGAAGLVVTLVVGSAASTLRSAVPQAESALPAFATGGGTDDSPPAGGAAVRVRVRPSMPPSLAMVAGFDLVLSRPPTTERASRGAAPAAAGVAEAPAQVLSETMVAAPAPIAPTTPTLVGEGPSTAPAPPVRPGKGRSKPRPTTTDAVSLASDGRVALAGAATDEAAGATPSRGRGRDGAGAPPPHAPAKGHPDR